MRKFLSSVKQDIRDLHQNIFNDEDAPRPETFQQPQQPLEIRTPSATDVFRYRYHHGANLGTVYVLEKWLSGHMFEGASDGQSSELEGVRNSVDKNGLDATRQKWEKHWAEAVSDADWEWLKNVAHCTTIRLPIGYFSLGPEFCRSTPFEAYGSVYTNCWQSILHLIRTARSKGIGVLVDFHAVPGGANPQEHSGTNSKRCELWDHSRHQNSALNCLGYMAHQIFQERLEGVVGLQICNEAEGWAQDRGMYQFYDKAIEVIRAVDSSLPVYISDAWNLDGALGYAMQKNQQQALYVSPVVIDTHLYFCFGDADKAKSPQQIIQEIPNQLSTLDGKAGSVVDKGAAEVAIGEYSCVLDGSTWDKSNGADRGELVKQFGQAQSRRYQQKAGGTFFWTYKMDWLPGGEWGFIEMTEKGAITAPAYLSIPHQQAQQSSQHANSMKEDMLKGAYGAHVGYWDQWPSDAYQHERYADGWQLGWADADTFWTGELGPQRIGMIELWVLKRCREYARGQQTKALWEWEQGFRKGVKDFENAVGIGEH